MVYSRRASPQTPTIEPRQIMLYMVESKPGGIYTTRLCNNCLDKLMSETKPSRVTVEGFLTHHYKCSFCKCDNIHTWRSSSDPKKILSVQVFYSNYRDFSMLVCAGCFDGIVTEGSQKSYVIRKIWALPGTCSVCGYEHWTASLRKGL